MAPVQKALAASAVRALANEPGLGELIRKDQDRQTLRNLLLEGAGSPLAGVADEAYSTVCGEALKTPSHLEA